VEICVSVFEQLLIQSVGIILRMVNLSHGALQKRSRIRSSILSRLDSGQYNFTYFRNLVRRLGINISLSVDRHNGLILLVLPRGWLIKFTDGLLNLMGLDDGLNGQWLEAGTYNGDRLINFTGTTTLHVHLDQINTTENSLNGTPTTLLCLVPVSCVTSIFAPVASTAAILWGG